MGRLLEFMPKGSVHTNVAPTTPQQRLEKLRTRTLDDVRDLVTYYNSTGTWANACEPHVIRAIEELYIVCEILTGVKYEQPAPRIG